ncbi:MAG: YkgJ family cysteine cluster protein [Bacteroidota bacterium]
MIQTDLSKIKYYAQKNEKQNWKFRSYLKYLDQTDAELDSLVIEISHQITKQIDCKTCANCCKEKSPSVLEEEILSISGILGISKEEFENKYLEKTGESDELIISKRPCPFLKNNLCEIYDNRPEDCRSYPHLHKEGFRFRLMGVIENYSVCPIVFNALDQLKEKCNFRA